MDTFYTELERSFLSFDAAAYMQSLREQIEKDLIPGDTSMLPCFLELLPTGEEKGDFLALDLGGSTFRVAIIRLLGGRQMPITLKSRSWKVRESAKITKSRSFFDWLACRVVDLLDEDNLLKAWRCGLAFSFPVRETGVNTGRIMLMGKGYNFSDDIGHVCIKDQLDQAFARKGLNIKLEAIVNDALATMLSHHYLDPRTRLSVILGTGCNSSLRMPSSIFPTEKLKTSENLPRRTTQVLVNAEMSMFGKHLLPWTDYDRQLDSSGLQPGYQTLEQFTSGRYMGELVRLILLDACQHHGLFNGQMPKSLLHPFTFDTSTMSIIAKDTSSDLSLSRKSLQYLHPAQACCYNYQEAQFIQAISRLVANRSSSLIAASLVVLSSLTSGGQDEEEEESLVAYCGTVMERYPGYLDACQTELRRHGAKLKLVRALDSGLIGAVVCAATVTRHQPGSRRVLDRRLDKEFQEKTQPARKSHMINVHPSVATA